MFAVLLLSFASADIIINSQPEEIYNLGDSFPIPVTITSQTDVSGVFQMILFCEGHQVEFYKNGVILKSGEEKDLEASLVMTKNMIGELSGVCKIKLIFRDDYILTNEFEISKAITLNLKEYPQETEPSQTFVIKGDAFKANSKEVNGFIEVKIVDGNTTIAEQIKTIKSGFFSANLTIPDELMAGNYLVTLNAYEKDTNDEITNTGFSSFNVYVRQVPRNLEIVVENPEVEPGTNLRVRTILHDQTGQNIATASIITLKDGKGKIIEQTEKNTDEIYEFFIEKNEAPSEWSVYALSNKLDSEITFAILEKSDVEIELLNDTVTITNVGNVFYNDSVLIKIGEQDINIDVELDLGESKKYLLKAPDGEYSVEIIADGESTIKEGISLTGKAVDVKEGKISKAFFGHPFVWIFVVLVLGFVTMIIFKKGWRKSIVGKFHKKKPAITPAVESKVAKHAKDSLINPKNKAIISLSIKGAKQNVNILCLNLKNFSELSGEGGVKETLDKIADADDKTFVYDNKENVFFIIAPSVTRTFKNEMNAVRLAQKIQKILKEHNRLFKNKIGFGISLNYGEIIAKKEKNLMEFVGVGKALSEARKIARISEGEILLSPEIKKMFGSEIKLKKHEHDGTEFYSIIEIVNKNQSKTFIEGFMKRNFG